MKKCYGLLILMLFFSFPAWAEAIDGRVTDVNVHRQYFTVQDNKTKQDVTVYWNDREPNITSKIQLGEPLSVEVRKDNDKWILLKVISSDAESSDYSAGARAGADRTAGGDSVSDSGLSKGPRG